MADSLHGALVMGKNASPEPSDILRHFHGGLMTFSQLSCYDKDQLVPACIALHRPA
jgi:hypothetical protein